MTADLDFDDTPLEENDFEIEADEEEVVAPKRNSLRTILLALLVLVLLCVVCYLASQYINIPGISPTPTATLAPTEEPTGEPTTEPTGEPTAEPTDDPLPTEEPTEEPTGEPTGEPTVEPTTEPTGEPTTEPTVEPTGEPTVDPCEQNDPPVADANGPYEIMMGKGQGVVNFDGSASSDSDGIIEGYEWDFGDASDPATGETVTHGYASLGEFIATLTVTDNCGATGVATADVTITEAAPPNGTVTPTPPPTVEPVPGEATFGFCHLVQYGQTLSGLSRYYGVPLDVLAAVNGVSRDYFVIAGQGLFIPMTEFTQGPNVYEALPGDTLYGVAWQCGLTPEIVGATNNLEPGTILMPGQQLVIPLWRQVYP
jgi:LysM repeat protein